MNKASVLVAAGLLLVTLAGPASAQNFRGRITKDGVRLVRPQEEPPSPKFDLNAQAANLASGVSEDSFMLKATQFAAGVRDTWNPFQASLERNRPMSRTSLISQVTATRAPVSVDFDAIEKAYADAVPRPPVPANLTGGTSVNSTPSLAAASNYMMAAAAHAAAMSATGVQTAHAAPSVDVDNCQCGTPVPSAHCTMSRMQNFGTNVNAVSRMRIAMPGAGFAVMPAVMMRGR